MLRRRHSREPASTIVASARNHTGMRKSLCSQRSSALTSASADDVTRDGADDALQVLEPLEIQRVLRRGQLPELGEGRAITEPRIADLVPRPHQLVGSPLRRIPSPARRARGFPRFPRPARRARCPRGDSRCTSSPPGPTGFALCRDCCGTPCSREEPPSVAALPCGPSSRAFLVPTWHRPHTFEISPTFGGRAA